MNLDLILSAYSIDIDKNRIKMIRHVPRSQSDWILIKKGYFEYYQAIQSRPDVINREYILSFLVDDEDRTIFKGLYKVLSQKIYEVNDVPSECIKVWKPNGKRKFYKIEKLPLLDELVDRLIIDWGPGKRKWDQNYHNREVQAILPKGFMQVFPGYLDFTLEWNQLENIINNPTANIDWKVGLSRVYGVYLILDEESGMQYIGSAYGDNGIWGRWKTYIETKSGGNAKLKELLSNNPDRYHKFRFSLIEILPNTSSKDEVIKKESRIKDKLGSRAFGLNLN